MMSLMIYMWISLMSFVGGPKKPANEFNILPSSKLEIKGSSNVNKFACDFQMQDISTVSVNYSPSTHKFQSALIKFPVQSFDCGSRLINRDFKDLLKEKEYPLLNIKLLEIEPIEEDRVVVKMEFEIAGVKKIYRMPASFTIMKGYYSSEGSIKINIEDFGLEQPKRMLGMIVINTEIDVHFKFDFV